MSKIKYPSKNDCPVKFQHTPCPSDYNSWHDWAAKMMKTHEQERCPECGYYAIWKKKRNRPVKETNESK